MSEQTSSDPIYLGAGPAFLHSSDTQEPEAASALEVTQEPALASTDIESPSLAPESLIPELGAAAEMPQADAPNAVAAEAEAPHMPGEIIIMPFGDRGWADHDAGSKPEAGASQGILGKRRIAALAAIVALAVTAGALGGALATAALTHVAGDNAASVSNHAVDMSIARIDADILALKASAEHASRLGMSQFNKTSDRLDKLEKAQAEPAARIARLSETVDKLRAASVPAAASSAAKDVTGSVSASATGSKAEVGKLPTVEGWVLRHVVNGGALIEGRQGIYEVYAGDPVPGLGRIDAIRRQDGRWVVVTSRGLVVAR